MKANNNKLQNLWQIAAMALGGYLLFSILAGVFEIAGITIPFFQTSLSFSFFYWDYFYLRELDVSGEFTEGWRQYFMGVPAIGAFMEIAAIFLGAFVAVFVKGNRIKSALLGSLVVAFGILSANALVWGSTAFYADDLYESFTTLLGTAIHVAFPSVLMFYIYKLGQRSGG